MEEIYLSNDGRIFLLDLLKVLRQHSDKDHRITQKEIMDLLMSEYGTSVSRRTIKNTMDRLIDYFERDQEEWLLYEEDERKIKNKKNNKDEILTVYTDFGFFHEFSHEELYLIIDSLLFSDQIPRTQRQEVIEKLEGLSSKYFNSRMKYIQTLSDHNHPNYSLFDNILDIDKAINESKKISFKYTNYTIDKNSNVTVTSRRNKEGQEREYIVNPYQLVATNGRYYLICNNDKYKNISNYRVDRITDVTITKERRKPAKELNGLERGLDISKHMAEHVYMFSGESILVKLKFKEEMLNDFIDWFGTNNVRFTKDSDNTVIASVNVNKQAMRKWALQYALHVRVISPDSLVKEVKADIEKALENYQ